jgi:hypothetical protein
VDGKRRIVIEPALAEKFLKIIEHHTAGDPKRGDITWTNLSRRQVAERMGALGTPVSRDVVSSCFGSTATAGACARGGWRSLCEHGYGLEPLTED